MRHTSLARVGPWIHLLFGLCPALLTTVCMPVLILVPAEWNLLVRAVGRSHADRLKVERKERPSSIQF